MDLRNEQHVLSLAKLVSTYTKVLWTGDAPTYNFLVGDINEIAVDPIAQLCGRY